MTAFHTIAVPHEDVLAGRLTMDVFAADLWEVYKERAPDEYRDARRFFEQTYETEGLSNLLGVVEKRLRGEGGDPVIQIQTPFGGGKTHALIAMYHKAVQWGASRAVVVGTPMAPTDTIWGLLAGQLSGAVPAGFEGSSAPGREPLRELLAAHQPLVILMDEVLEYATKAAGQRVGESTLAAQTLAFLQELTEAVATLDRTCLAVTLPSSLLEHYDEGAERLFHQLQKVAGRVEKIYTPVQEHEISCVIRQRLFKSVDEKAVEGVVGAFLKYAIGESLLPAGVEPSQYRRRFERSYPFLPEVVDVLYQRWGSFPSFQRTRGVLRLVSLVIHALKEQDIPYVSLADFELGSQELRRELLKHIGPEFDSVIAADITGEESGARKVDGELGAAYRGLRLGTRVSNSMFMYSFSGGVERGATLGEIKRSATTTGNPASVVAEATELLKSQYLFFVRQVGGRYVFSNEPNITRIRRIREENVGASEIRAREESLLKARVSGRQLRVFVWPASEDGIPETPELKLVLLRERDDALMERILKRNGNIPRVHGNAILFLVAQEGERPAFEGLIRKLLAYEMIQEDQALQLKPGQKKEVADGIKKTGDDLREWVRRAYRQLFVPARDGLKELDLGIPTYGDRRSLDEEVYDRLRMEGDILERVAPLVIKERYLRDQPYVLTEQLARASLRTPGEPRVVSDHAWREAIVEGVRKGLFGLGDLEGEQPVCRYFKESTDVALMGAEVIIPAAVCEEQKCREVATGGYSTGGEDVPSRPGTDEAVGPVDGEGAGVDVSPRLGWRHSVRLRFSVPKGKVASLMGLMNFLQAKFNRMDIVLETSEGRMSDQEYEDKVEETFRQMGIDVAEQ